MPESESQTYETHVRKLPRAYLAAGLVLALNIIGTTAFAVLHPSLPSIALVFVAIALFGTHWFARTNALVVQNRVIRLEERLRMLALLPDDLRPRLLDLDWRQLVALRFACDEELPELVRKVLDEKIEDPEAIKRLVKSWRADHLRV